MHRPPELQTALGNEHDVEVVTSAIEALTRIQAGHRFDLVLSDLLMPEMAGMPSAEPDANA